jgi:hypothetical protein
MRKIAATSIARRIAHRLLFAGPVILDNAELRLITRDRRLAWRVITSWGRHQAGAFGFDQFLSHQLTSFFSRRPFGLNHISRRSLRRDSRFWIDIIGISKGGRRKEHGHECDRKFDFHIKPVERWIGRE